MTIRKTLPPPILDADDDSFASLEYQNQQQAAINANASGLPFTSLDFSNSNLTELAIRLHNQLQGLQGGAANEFYHLNATQFALFSQFRVFNTVIISNTGTIVAGGFGLTTVKNSTGLFTITFNTAQSNANYNLQVTPSFTGALVPNILNTTVNSFQVSFVNQSGVATDPTKFYVTIS